MAEQWEQALFAVGLLLFLVLAGFVYYRTGDSYKIRKKRKELGYETDDWCTALSLCCIVCIGPVNRSRWERKHRHFRTEDYGPLDKNWKKVLPADAPNQEWQALPRGDTDYVKQLLAATVARLETEIVRDCFEDALDIALVDMREQLAPKAKRLSMHYASQSEEEHLAIAEAHEERLRVWEQQAMTELSSNMTTVGVAAPVLSVIAMRANKQSEANTRAIDFDQPARVNRLDNYSMPLKLRDLRDLVNKMDELSLREQFRSLPLNVPEEVDDAMAPYLAQNRDRRIPPTRHTNIKVDSLPGSTISGYIHANSVRGADGNPMRFIATQGPLDGTERGTVSTQEAFWHMVWQYQACGVVSLVLPTRERCPRYWPTSEEKTAQFGPLRVDCLREDKKSSYTMAVLRVTVAGRQHEHILMHFTFGWPHQSVPTSTGAFRELLKDLGSLLKRYPEPLVVHDDRGFGPTGVMLASLHGMQHLETKYMVDVLRVVASLREDRGAMVETLAEYQFLHRLLALHASQLSGARAPPAYKAAPSFDSNNAAYDRAMNNQPMPTGESATPSLSRSREAEPSANTPAASARAEQAVPMSAVATPARQPPAQSAPRPPSSATPTTSAPASAARTQPQPPLMPAVVTPARAPAAATPQPVRVVAPAQSGEAGRLRTMSVLPQNVSASVPRQRTTSALPPSAAAGKTATARVLTQRAQQPAGGASPNMLRAPRMGPAPARGAMDASTLSGSNYELDKLGSAPPLPPP